MRRYTGHPLPRAQTARRVCISAAGYTEGVETLDGPRLFCGRAPVRREVPELHVVAPEPPPPPKQRRVTGPSTPREAPRVMEMLDVLRRVGPELPTIADLARAIGYEHPGNAALSRVNEMLRALHRRGLIVWWRGVEHERHGMHAVRIVSSGRVLRSPGCPAEVWP